VVVSYRLSPAVKHPCHCQDVALALKFVDQNIVSYNGDPNLVFLMGHSAGGHICSLLGLNPDLLQQVELDPSFIKGIVSVSGVYDVSVLARESKLVLRMIIAPGKQLFL
jgi:arylformamidase